MDTMNIDSRYDVVLEMESPLVESSEAAYDKWGKETRTLIRRLTNGYPGVHWTRVARSGNLLKVSVRCGSLPHATKAMGFLLAALSSRTPSDVSIKLHECPPLVVSELSPV
jgi:hypothetical protein